MLPLAPLFRSVSTVTPTVTPTAATSTGTPGSSTAMNWLTSLEIVLGCVVLFLVLFWLSLILWTWRDSRSRTHDLRFRILAVVLVAVFFLGGLFAYLLVRPRQTQAERNALEWEEAALLADLAERQVCPQCRTRVEADFQTCPSCGGRLKHPCPMCTHLLELGWASCPYCATSLARPAMRSQPGRLTLPGFSSPLASP